MSDQVRIALAVLISALVLVFWQYFFAPVHDEVVINVEQGERCTEVNEYEKELPREYTISTTQRVFFENQFVKGSINLKGAVIDDLMLKKFKESENSEGSLDSGLLLLSPIKSKNEYFVEFGWVGEKGLILPDLNTEWTLEESKENCISMQYLNDQGVNFKIKFYLDEQYLIQVIQEVENYSSDSISLRPRAVIRRIGAGSENSSIIMHEGAIGSIASNLKEISFKDLQGGDNFTYKNEEGWVGFSDKYWLVSLFNPLSTEKISGSFSYDAKTNYRVSYLLPTQELDTKATCNASFNLFAGPKQLDVLSHYQSVYNISLFDRAVDFGILYFITKPIFLFLHEVYLFTGNFGFAILILTVLIKLALLPLSYKSFVGMGKMKELQPKINKIREKFANNPVELQKATLDIYRKNNINPLSGCLPVLLQMPVFFALYKVLYVTIEMRHAPFCLWITDLSIKDPTNIFNLFGLIEWDPPSFLSIGVLPILMALSMYIQQKMNPEPTDPVQAKVMKFLPLFFLIMFASFPSGLVLYWLWSNILSILQQQFIRKLITKTK